MTVVTHKGAVGAFADLSQNSEQNSEVLEISRIGLFGLRVGSAESADALKAMLDGSERLRIAFLNAHCVNTAYDDQDYRSADMVLPDSSGLSIDTKLKGAKFVANLNVTDLFPQLCAAVSKRGLSVYLLGGAPGQAEASAFAARRIAPGLRVAGVRDGFF